MPTALDYRPSAGVDRGQLVDADDSARMRDLLADNGTLLAWIRTGLAFAGLGFAAAKARPTALNSGRVNRFRVPGEG